MDVIPRMTYLALPVGTCDIGLGFAIDHVHVDRVMERPGVTDDYGLIDPPFHS